ncbi:hypothetical protein HYV31_03875 [candidate division WWE3 bacterium]|nr:hypothetical protein [candidate division WWE3 bacterium]
MDPNKRIVNVFLVILFIALVLGAITSLVDAIRKPESFISAILQGFALYLVLEAIFGKNPIARLKNKK